jgi:hypothetical protein
MMMSVGNNPCLNQTTSLSHKELPSTSLENNVAFSMIFEIIRNAPKVQFQREGNVHVLKAGQQAYKT